LNFARRGKIELGSMPWNSPKIPPRVLTWAIGRLGARAPVYGPLNTVVPVEVASQWLEHVLACGDGDSSSQLAIMQLARRTDDRYRDVSPTLRGRAIDWLDDQSAPAHFAQIVRDGGRLDAEEQSRIFGESLPSGLRVIN
jgi:hypothetical protein